MHVSPGDAQRFWDKVCRRDARECWEWLAWCDPKGYGAFRLGPRMQRAHRVAYHIHHGKIPEGMHILHHCDNPACCNPSHLYCGTNEDNVNDRVVRKRSPKTRPERQGEKHFNARLCEQDVRDILRRSESEPQRGLAAEYGITEAHLSNIVKGKRWGHVR